MRCMKEIGTAGMDGQNGGTSVVRRWVYGRDAIVNRSSFFRPESWILFQCCLPRSVGVSLPQEEAQNMKSLRSLYESKSSISHFKD